MKFKKNMAVFLFGLLAVSSGSVYAGWDDDDYDDDRITVYEHCDYKGKSTKLSAGKYYDSREAGFGNDSISSIRIPKNTRVTVYKDKDFKGGDRTFSSSVRCLSGSLNDQISSIKVRKGSSSWDDDDSWSDRDEEDSWGEKKKSHCTTYTLRSRGGAGGFRLVDDSSAFIQVNNGDRSSKTCLTGNRRVEVSKQDVNADVKVNINGRVLHFRAGDQGEKNVSGWYRRYYNVNF